MCIRDRSKAIEGLFGTKLTSEAFIATWTTTPWTLPGNKAMSINPNFDYVLIETGFNSSKKSLVVSSKLLEKTLERYEMEKFNSLGQVKGKELEGLKCKHPFFDQESTIISSSHVTEEIGTGFVHTAPAHGLEDYEACRDYDFDNSSLVQADGKFAEEVPYVGGKKISEANQVVIDILKSKNLLMSKNKFRHSFPHCWRHKTPLFFRATPQWLSLIHISEPTRH